jgi:hypothetical protein
MGAKISATGRQALKIKAWINPRGKQASQGKSRITNHKSQGTIKANNLGKMHC